MCLPCFFKQFLFVFSINPLLENLLFVFGPINLPFTKAFQLLAMRRPNHTFSINTTFSSSLALNTAYPYRFLVDFWSPLSYFSGAKWQMVCGFLLLFWFMDLLGGFKLIRMCVLREFQVRLSFLSRVLDLWSSIY